jgi:membrane protease YdiL (CAAX protease family)
MSASRRRRNGSPSARSSRTGPSLLFAPQAARPWPSLLFLSPFLAFYTAGLIWVRPDLAAGADLLLRRALFLAGPSAVLALAGLIVAVLLVWHLVRRDPWRFPAALVLAMGVETALLAVPLLALHGLFQAFAAGPGPIELAVAGPARTDLVAVAMTSIGAGIYEELLFRLVLVGGLALVAERVFRLARSGAAVAAVLVAAALFAGAHTFQAPGSFTWPTFLFRTAAGVYLAAVFATRGFGIAAGVHIGFNLAVKLTLSVP